MRQNINYFTVAEASVLEKVSIRMIVKRIHANKYKNAIKCPHCKNNWLIPEDNLYCKTGLKIKLNVTGSGCS